MKISCESVYKLSRRAYFVGVFLACFSTVATVVSAYAENTVMTLINYYAVLYGLSISEISRVDAIYFKEKMNESNKAITPNLYTGSEPSRAVRKVWPDSIRISGQD